MEWLWLILVIPLAAAIGHAFTAGSLQRKFVSLGVIAGKTRGEIEAAVGHPNSISAVSGNQILLQWQVTGYHIALLFEDDVCLGVAHEHVNS